MKTLQNGFKQLTRFLIPQTCLCCDRFIGSEHHICTDCDRALYPITDPACPKCALPRESREGVNALCSRCISENRYFDQIYAAFEYEGNVKQIFSRAKYGRREDTIQSLTEIVVKRRLLDLPTHLSVAAWVCVPMHNKDLRERGFNTSRLILNSLRDFGVASKDRGFVEKTLPRERGNNKTDREIFSKKAFRLTQSLDQIPESVVVVDDVMSSGATISAIAKLLKKAGVKNVYGVVLARNI